MTLRLRGKSLLHGLLSNINTSTRKNVSAGGGTNRKRGVGVRTCPCFSHSVQQPLRSVVSGSIDATSDIYID